VFSVQHLTKECSMSKRILGPRLAALASLCTLVAVAGCSAISGASAGASAVSSTAASAQSAALTGTSWQLTELAGQPGARQTLQFDASQGRVSGNGGCNNFSGGYQWSGKSLKMGPLASTRRACVDDATSRPHLASGRQSPDPGRRQRPARPLHGAIVDQRLRRVANS
jgi:heat shock protein HslJ